MDEGTDDTATNVAAAAATATAGLVRPATANRPANRFRVSAHTLPSLYSCPKTPSVQRILSRLPPNPTAPLRHHHRSQPNSSHRRSTSEVHTTTGTTHPTSPEYHNNNNRSNSKPHLNRKTLEISKSSPRKAKTSILQLCSRTVMMGKTHLGILEISGLFIVASKVLALIFA